jgi:seryl-tRNA synthetase
MNELDLPLEQPLKEEQLQFVSEALTSSFSIESIGADDDRLRVRHGKDEEAPAIRSMTRRFLFIAKSLNVDTVFSNDVEPRCTEDPQPHLEARRDVIPVHPGFFTLQGDFLRVFRALNARVRGFAADLGAIEQEYPAVWPVRLFKKIDYFHEFPQQVVMCAPVKDDYEARDEFARRYAKGRQFDAVEMDGLFAPSEYGLEPAVCDCCYYGLEGERDTPDAYYTCYNKVFRNERSALGGLDRLTNFSVRDIMFVGRRDFVLEARQTLIEILSDFLGRLQLNVRIATANDPFFANDAAMKSVFQNSHRLKYELLALIPHLDKRIAIGSVNLHLDVFGKAFDIETSSGELANSGCIGVGMERASYALFCQHGHDLAGWPPAVVDYLGLDAS